MTLCVEDSAKLFNMLDTQHEDWIIARAMEIVERRIFHRSRPMLHPDDVKNFLRAQLNTERNEVFAALFLDAQHRVIAYEELFKGTIDSATVHPRVVLSRALEHNAAAIIFAHNHPSGVTDPSLADRTLTRRLISLLGEVNVRVLDHFIVGEGQPFSFAAMDLL